MTSTATPREPTVAEVARRPRWIVALLAALLLAGGFAALGQWQLERSVARPVLEEGESERVVPLTEVAQPQQPMEEQTRAQYQRVSVSGEFVPQDTSVVVERVDRGRTGAWVVGHFVDAGGASLAVAIGWAPSEADAASAAARFAEQDPSPVDLVGRYLPSEAPETGEFEERNDRMSAAALINTWSVVPEAAYGGYLVAGEAPAGLETIDSPPPSPEVALNWLNIFYAVEWAVFAVFAVYLWYRLVKDAWEREIEELRDAAGAGEPQAATVD